MPKISQKRSIQQYWNSLIYMQTALSFHPETQELISEFQPLMRRLEQLIQDEKQWTQSMLNSKARLLAARQTWKLGFNRLLKFLNTFDYAVVREIQEPILEVYPRGNRGADYDVQVKNAKVIFQSLLNGQELSTELRAKLESMVHTGEKVLHLWDEHQAVLMQKEHMKQEQTEAKNEINMALQRVEKKLKKMFPYEHRYLRTFFYK